MIIKNNRISKCNVYMCSDFGASKVDKSSFRPTVDEARIVAGQSVLNPRVGLYDFPDGKDTGLRLTMLRDKSADRTEIDFVKSKIEAKINQDSDKASEQLKKEVEQAEKETKSKKTEELLQQVVDNTSSSSKSDI